MNIYERVKYLRKNILNITQDDFSKKIKISRSNLGSIETGRVNITDRVISDICNEFSVNESWLRNGGSDDEIFINLSEDEEVENYVQMLLNSTDDIITETIKKFVIIYQKLDDNSKQILRNLANDLLGKTKKTTNFADDIPDTAEEFEKMYPPIEIDTNKKKNIG